MLDHILNAKIVIKCAALSHIECGNSNIMCLGPHLDRKNIFHLGIDQSILLGDRPVYPLWGYITCNRQQLWSKYGNVQLFLPISTLGGSIRNFILGSRNRVPLIAFLMFAYVHFFEHALHRCLVKPLYLR